MSDRSKWVNTFLVLMFWFSANGVCQIAVQGELTHKLNVQPGNIREGSIAIENVGSEVQQVNLLINDYRFSYDGTSEYMEPGSLERSNSTWITLIPTQLILDPGESDEVTYTIHVPEIDTLIGSYWCMIMVEPAVSPLQATGEGFRVQSVIRYGIQIITNIGNTGSGAIRFLDTRLLSENGKRFLQIDIENVGERFLRPKLWVEMYDSTGTRVGKYESESRRTYPGTSIRRTIDLSQVPVGAYKALLVADCGGADLFGNRYNLIISE